MQSHISCMCVIFPNVSYHVSSQIACLNRCKVTRVADVQNFSNMSQKLPPARFYSKSSDFQNLSVFGDFYAFTVCHEIVHVSLCPLIFSVASLSPFSKWLWPNDCFSVIPIDSSLQQKLNTYIDLDRKSEFSKQNGQSPPDPSCCQEISQMQTVWLFFQQTFQVENPHDGSQQKEAFCLCTVQLFLQ